MDELLRCAMHQAAAYEVAFPSAARLVANAMAANFFEPRGGAASRADLGEARRRYMAAYGARVREARTAARMKLAELGARLGMSGQSVGLVEAGKQQASAFQVMVTADALGCDPRWLLVGAAAADSFDRKMGDGQVTSELKPERVRAEWCVQCDRRVGPADRVTDVAVRPVRQRCKVHGEVLQIDARTPQPVQGVVIYWSDITPSDAVGIALPMDNIEGPLATERTSDGKGVLPPAICPWPWQAQQLPGGGGPAVCKYCGSTVISGMPHPDARFEGLHRGVGGDL